MQNYLRLAKQQHVNPPPYASELGCRLLHLHGSKRGSRQNECGALPRL